MCISFLIFSKKLIWDAYGFRNKYICVFFFFPVHYLTTHFQYEDVIASRDMMKHESEKVLRMAVVAGLKYYPVICLEGQENHEEFQSRYRYPGQDSNQTCPIRV
jgi:hypothetical protein